jgi:hypothetical protein
MLSFTHMAGAAVVLNAYLALRRQPNGSGHSVCGPSKPFDGESAVPCDIADDGWVNDLVPWLRQYGHYIVPISAMFAASVCLRNSAFAGLPLPLMQLMGSCAPLGTYVLSVATGLGALTLPSLCCMVACVLGVTIAISGRSIAAFSTFALARHASGIGLELCRGVILQHLIVAVTEHAGPRGSPLAVIASTHTQQAALTAIPVVTSPTKAVALTMGTDLGHALKGHACTPLPPPLSTILLAMYSPVCAAMLAVPAFAFEAGPALADVAARPHWFWVALAGNIATALALNLVAVSSLHRAGVVAMSLTGFIKDWILVVLSTVAFGTEVSLRFVVGMLVTTGAVGVHGNMRGRG